MVTDQTGERQWILYLQVQNELGEGEPRVRPSDTLAA